MPASSLKQPPKDSAAAAEFIAKMAKDLSAIAQRNGLDTLGYLLEIAQLEAQRHADEGTRG
jgi:hypothetical protein